jgi:hypothetical protein
LRALTKRLTELQGENDRWRKAAANQFGVIQLQASLLSDAGDIFDQINLGTVWQRTLDRHLGIPGLMVGGEVGAYGTPAAVAHQREAHGTITAQSGL